MAVATFHPSSDGSRFEVHSRVSSSVPKMIVKSAHRAEIARWVQTIKLNIEYYSKTGQEPSGGELRSAPSKSDSLNSGPSSTTVASLPPTDSFLNARLSRTATQLSGLNISRLPGASSRARPPSPAGTAGTETMDEDDGLETISMLDMTDKDSFVGGTASNAATSAGMPHANTFDMGVLNLKAQIELTQQLIDSVVTPPTSTSASPERGAPMIRTRSRQQAVKDALKSSLATLGTQISQQNIMSQDRERYLLGRIQREVQARHVWEENMLAVAQQQADTDLQLREAAKDNEKKRKALRQARGVLAGLGGGAAIGLPTSPGMEGGTPVSNGPGMLDVALGSATTQATTASYHTPISSPTFNQGPISNIQEVHDAVVAAGGAGPDSDDEDEDEFFDAIEQNTIPNLRTYDSIANPAKERAGTPKLERAPPPFHPVVEVVQQPQPSQGITQPRQGTTQPRQGATQPRHETIQEMLARRSLQPYQNVRERLPIDDDKRPSVSCTLQSLWDCRLQTDGRQCGAS